MIILTTEVMEIVVSKVSSPPLFRSCPSIWKVTLAHYKVNPSRLKMSFGTSDKIMILRHQVLH